MVDIRHTSGNLSRRKFVKNLAASAAGLAMPGLLNTVAPLAAGTSKNKLPNIVMILSDDHSIYDVGCYGSTSVRTPNIDRLAAEGTRFTHAFTSTCMCAPSRSMCYTGLYPHRNGAHKNHSRIRPDVKSLFSEFKQMGYTTALVGKTHISPLDSFAFDEVLEMTKVQNKQNEKTFDKMVHSFITTRLQDMQPFCLVIATCYPHGPFIKKTEGGIQPSKITLPKSLVNTPLTRKRYAACLDTVEALDHDIGEYRRLLEEQGLLDDTILIYASDHGSQWPFAKWTLYDAGIRIPLIIRWPGKVKPGKTNDAMISMVDILPTLIEAGRGKVPKDIDGESFLPVLLNRKDTHRQMVFGTHTNKGIVQGKPYPIRSVRTRTHKYIVNLEHQSTVTNIMMANKAPQNFWKEWQTAAKKGDAFAAKQVERYLHRPRVELYDIKKDPYEMHNLAGKSKYKTMITELHSHLKVWMQAQGDPLIGQL